MKDGQYLDLVLGVVGIIEGLALSKLAESFSNFLYDHGEMPGLRSLNLILCFFIILRIFQGFVAGSLDPVRNKDLQVQLVIALTFGVAQYAMISAIDRDGSMTVVYRIAAVIAALGALSHGWNRYDLRSPTAAQRVQPSHAFETRFQEASCALMSVAFVVLLGAGFVGRGDVKGAATAVAILLVSVNAYLSYELLSFNMCKPGERSTPPMLSRLSAFRPNRLP